MNETHRPEMNQPHHQSKVSTMVDPVEINIQYDGSWKVSPPIAKLQGATEVKFQIVLNGQPLRDAEAQIFVLDKKLFKKKRVVVRGGEETVKIESTRKGLYPYVVVLRHQGKDVVVEGNSMPVMIVE